MSEQQRDVTHLLASWRDGDTESSDRLMAVVYDKLRRMARGYLGRERGDHTLQPTALVHEAFVKLVDRRATDWQDRGHFFATAAQAMRRILVDHARKHRNAKHGGGKPRVPLEKVRFLSVERSAELLALDDCLTALAKVDPHKARIVELRFFAGLSLEDTALALGCSRTTVVRQWRMAQTWLYREMAQEHGE